ncbi:unnamed protein product, partial [Symbiodinium necroappetens]
AWNETEVPINISIVTEAINASEDLLEDDNESTELDGNLSAAKLVSVSLRTDCYPKGWSSRAAAEQWRDRRERVGGAELQPLGSFKMWSEHKIFEHGRGQPQQQLFLRVSEDVPMAGNESANESDAWNQTEPPNGEAGNASDALEDDNESVVLDGNLSNRTAENLADVSNSSRLNAVLPSRQWLLDSASRLVSNWKFQANEGVPIMGNKSANDSNAWNETQVPINISVVTEAINASEDLLDDDNESTELDGNLSDAKLASVSL